MSRIKFDIQSERVQIVLALLKAAGAIALLALAPGALRLLKPARRHYSEESIRRTAYYLKRRGDVRFVNQNGQVFVSITKKGYNRLAQLESLRVRLPAQKPNTWDGKWRIVIFDIPERDRNLRDAFRSKLRELECVRLQGSVWVTPYEVRGEIKRLCEAGRFSRIAVQCILAYSFDEEVRFRKLFRLTPCVPKVSKLK